VGDEMRYVVGAFPERRYPDGEHVQSIEEIGAEWTLLNHLQPKQTALAKMRNQRADANSIGLLRDLIESGYRLEVNQVRVMHRPLLQQNHQGRPAGDEPSLITVLQQELARFSQRTRLQEIKRSDRHGSFHRN